MSLWGVLGTVGGAFLVGPLGASIGGTIGGALDQSGAAKDAQRAQQAATDAAIGEQRRQFDLTRGDFAPYREAGVKALGSLQSDLDKPLSSADVLKEPGYMFGLQQGLEAIDRKIAAMGGRVSGAAIKAAGRYGTDYATTGYGAAYQRRQDRLNRLAAIAGVGQTATGGSAAAGANAANNIGQIYQSQGDASAAGRIAQGNIWGGAGNQIAALYSRHLQQKQPTPFDNPIGPVDTRDNLWRYSGGQY